MEIRLIPMSMEDTTFVGKNIEQIQTDFFKGSLITEEKGWYYYAKTGLDAKEGDLLLFQIQNSIIASATLDYVLKFKKPTSDGNCGTFVLKIDTIKTFKPISKDEMKEIIKGFNSFNQTKAKFNIKEVDMEKLNLRINNL